jgi:aminoglycoside phosphotransferase (APT) family kinase protein
LAVWDSEVTAAYVASRVLPLRRLATHWRHRPELQWAARVAPHVLAGLEGTREAEWRTEAVTWTGTSVAVVMVMHRSCKRRLVVKIPSTVEGSASLKRQIMALSAIAHDPRLRDWEAALPWTLHEGEVAGRYYCVEEAVPGEQTARLILQREYASTLLNASARIIDGLHSRTAKERRVDDAAIEAWVNRPLGQLERFAVTRRRCDELLAGVERMRDDLTSTLLGRTVRLSWIHGDFWPGNILGWSGSGRITGIVDWDQAESEQLRLHDLLHLHLYARRVRRAEELGTIVVEALTAGVPKVAGVPAGQIDAWTDGVASRSSLLLYWLRHVTLFLDSDGHRDNRHWLHNNVEKVLLQI